MGDGKAGGSAPQRSGAATCRSFATSGSFDELRVAMGRYAAPLARLVTGMAAMAPQAFEVLRIASPAAHGSPATDLLARLQWREPRERYGSAVLYLHGFPDQSLDHREEDAAFGSFASRFPRKLAETVLADLPEALFVAFNFAGAHLVLRVRECPVVFCGAAQVFVRSALSVGRRKFFEWARPLAWAATDSPTSSGRWPTIGG